VFGSPAKLGRKGSRSTRACHGSARIYPSLNQGIVAEESGFHSWSHFSARATLSLFAELLRNVGDGRGQAASGCWLTASMPSMNFTPVISFGNWLWPSRRRQLFSAACASLKTMAIAVLVERHPLERTVRCRTVAHVRSTGLVVRRCFQCSAGKS